MIFEGNGKSVDFRLDGIQRGMSETLTDFRNEILDFLIGKNIGKTSHAHGMHDLLEFIERGASDAPRWGVLTGELRIFFFQCDKLVKKLVIFVVGYLRRVFDVV